MKSVLIYIPTIAYRRMELQYFGLSKYAEDSAGENLKKLYPEPNDKTNIIK